MLDGFLQDVRYAFRQLRKSPGFAITAILTLALSIGANTAIYSLFDQVLLRRLPVRDPQKLVVLEYLGADTGSTSDHGGPQGSYFSYPMYKDLRDRNQVFDGLIASDITQVGVQWHNQPELANTEMVSGNYFDVLGVQPAAGRLFVQADDLVQNANPVVVLSYAYWQRRFGLDPHIINDVITINGHPFTVVGVTAPGFQSVQVGFVPAIYTPMMMKPIVTPSWNELENRRAKWMNIIGRVKPGMTASQAEAGLDSLWHSIRAEELKALPGARSDKFRQNFAEKSHLYLRNGARGFSLLDQYRMPMLIVMAMVLLVALMACANVATLLLVRAAGRMREMSVRYAMGAKRSRIIQQLLSEGLFLGIAGGVLGFLIATPASAMLIRKGFADSNGNLPFSSAPNLRILLFNFALALLVSLIFSVAPAIQFWRPNLAPALKQQTVTAGGGPLRFRRLSVAVQVGLSLVLLVGAGLFVRTLNNLKSVNVGFTTEHLLTFGIDPQLAGYEASQTLALHRRLRETLAQLPGVQAVASTTDAELANTNESSNFSIAGVKENDETLHPEWAEVSARYFETMQMPLILGRGITDADTRTSPKVAVVNESLARKHFGSPDKAIGQMIARGSSDDANYDIQIVGVVRDAKHSGVREDVRQTIFTPFTQMIRWEMDAAKKKQIQVPNDPDFLTYYVRTWQAPDAAMGTIRAAVQGVDSKLVLDTFRSMDAQIDDNINTERMIALLASGFGILAAILAAVGLYGVLAYSTAQRTREIGVRMALGASRLSVVQMVMRDVLLLAGIGVVFAVPVSLLLSRYMRAQLFGVSNYDPVTLLVVIVLVALVALAAAMLPARRAASVDPMKALRYE